MDEYKYRTTCRVCGSNELTKIADFGDVPLSNSLVDGMWVIPKKYPISVNYCSRCSLTQLGVVVNPEILYEDYCYQSSVSDTFKKHCADLAKHLKEITYSKHPFVIDIASNDGCLLEQFRKVGFDVLGVEPSTNLCRIANDKGIYTINDFWNEKTKVLNRADCITATNIVAHIDDLDGFLKGVANNLTDNGVFVIEVPWALNMILSGQFDTIYHEHLSYFLLKPLMEILKRNSLNVFRVEEVKIHGGSLRIYSAKGIGREPDNTVGEILALEEENGMYDIATYKNFGDNSEYSMDLFISMLSDLHDKKVAGLCASAKGLSLINYCGLTVNDIALIADETPSKQGKFIPEANIPIVDMQALIDFNPDYLILFSWNFIDELKRKTSWFKGRYIVPIPYARID
jgi:novobiocin biosynthesis protein NovU/D-mycarose 3-C-methyltransferase